MILSARLIKRPRRLRECGSCGRFIDGQQLRLYGAADYGDKPYNLYLHPKPPCIAVAPDPKIVKALEATR